MASFERDFGYLMPFFDRVEAAAAELSAPGAADELRRLMEGEKAKWQRIQELLSGAPGRAAGVHAPAAVQRSSEPQPRPLQAGLTVGSLRNG